MTRYLQMLECMTDLVAALYKEGLLPFPKDRHTEIVSSMVGAYGSDYMMMVERIYRDEE